MINTSLLKDIMERIESIPRTMVWPAKRDEHGQVRIVQIKVRGKFYPAIELDTRRCICGAKPNPAGELPCNH